MFQNIPDVRCRLRCKSSSHPWGMVPGEACPLVVAACWGAAEPSEPILEEQEVGAPCQEEQEVAWASEAYLWNRMRKSFSFDFPDRE